MACVTVPVSTLFGTSEVTTTSVSTIFQTETTTIPGAITTSTISSCPLPLASGSSACPVPESFITTTISQPDSVQTLTSTTSTTLPITLTSTFPTNTILSTSCPPSGNNDNNSTTTDPSNNGMVTTPKPVVTTSSSSTTLDNGSVSVVFFTFTSTPPPVTHTVGEPGLNGGSSNDNGSSSNLAPILGGALGGFFGLLALVTAILCWRRKRNWDDIFEKDIGHGVGDDDDVSVRVEPAPYQYGLVGHSQSPSMSPPASPNLHPAMTQHSRVSSFANASVHSRESTAPLTANIGAVNQDNGQWLTPRRASVPEVPLLSRPITQPADPVGVPRDRQLSTTSGTSSLSPTSPNFAGFFIANASPEEQREIPSQPLASPAAPKRASPNRQSRDQVIVHTDGGRVGQSSASPLDRTDEPPAYTS